MTRFLTDMVCEKGGRRENQDHCNFLSRSEANCWVVADGLGGHGGGEVASQLVVNTVLKAFMKDSGVGSSSLEDYVKAANLAILDHQQTTPDLGRMGSTLVLLAADREAAVCAHVGDSRLYHFRQGRLSFQSRDHSAVQALADAGEISPLEIRFHPDRGNLRRSLGRLDSLESSIPTTHLSIEPDDAFLLCSDGFWELVFETEMEIELARAEQPGDWLAGMVERLKKRADGEYDNYTAVAVFVEE